MTRQTGKLDASNRNTTGGSVPAGSRRKSAIARFAMLLSAAFESVPGLKKILIRLTPVNDLDSMWSMLLPSVKNRSNVFVMSPSICCGGIPE